MCVYILKIYIYTHTHIKEAISTMKKRKGTARYGEQEMLGWGVKFQHTPHEEVSLEKMIDYYLSGNYEYHLVAKDMQVFDN